MPNLTYARYYYTVGGGTPGPNNTYGYVKEAPIHTYVQNTFEACNIAAVSAKYNVGGVELLTDQIMSESGKKESLITNVLIVVLLDIPITLKSLFDEMSSWGSGMLMRKLATI